MLEFTIAIVIVEVFSGSHKDVWRIADSVKQRQETELQAEDVKRNETCARQKE